MLVVEFFFINIDTVQSSDFSILVILCTIWYHWHNFKKREKQLQPATLVEVSLLHGCLLRFLNVQMVPNRAKRFIF